ncbi:MAG: DUF5684 domain-containing protein [Candidatus Omnitrophica bacterium]|nr:DUF5684 domain-containing protein [Candidatus Omnitrophota bacterium]
MKIKLTLFLLVGLGLVLPAAFGVDIYYRGEVSPYRIIQKSGSALYNVDSYAVTFEELQQGPYAHRKLKYTEQVKDLTDSAVEGRVSYSYYGFADGDSDSFWIKSYTIRGVPFSWNSKKKEWKNEALHIEDKYAREQISYSFLNKLGGVDAGSVDPDSLKLVTEEEKNGKDCYLVSYKYLSSMLKRYGLVGKLGVRLWVEKDTFLPVKKRIEGNIAGTKYSVEVTYSRYGDYFDFNLPSYVSEESEKEKKTLESKVDEVASAVASLRGWQSQTIKDFKIEFAKKNRIKDELLKDLRARYSDQELTYEGEILKWLGLIPEDADYPELVFDSSDVGFIAGVYIPSIKTLFVADDLIPAQAELTLFHEMVHAFQDSKLDFQKLNEAFKSDMNAYRAFMCFIEGEAALLQLEYLLSKSDETLQDWEDISRLIDEKVAHGFLRDKVFYSVYGYGAMFIQDYLKQNSWDWKKLDNVYRSYPQTMEEIMHPDEYKMKSAIKGIAKLVKTAPAIGELQIDDWEKVYSNRLGEYHLFVMLDEDLSRKESELASMGWSNDRIDVYEDSGQGQLIVLQTTWDSPKDQSEFLEAYQNWLQENEFTSKPEETGETIFYKEKNSQMVGWWSQGGNNKVTIVGTRDVDYEIFKAIADQITSPKIARPVQNQQAQGDAPQGELVINQDKPREQGSSRNSISSSGQSAGVLAGSAIMFFLMIGLYAYMSLSLQVIAKKTSTGKAWLAWVPVLNIILMCKIAKKPGWWLLLLLVPGLNIVILIIVCMKIAERLGKPSWLGVLLALLVPINLFILGYLAFSKQKTKAAKKELAQESKEPLVEGTKEKDNVDESNKE